MVYDATPNSWNYVHGVTLRQGFRVDYDAAPNGW